MAATAEVSKTAGRGAAPQLRDWLFSYERRASIKETSRAREAASYWHRGTHQQVVHCREQRVSEEEGEVGDEWRRVHAPPPPVESQTLPILAGAPTPFVCWMPVAAESPACLLGPMVDPG